MVEGRPSLTAQGAAVLRAAHQLWDVPRVFDDPLALPIIGADGERTLRADERRHQTRRRRQLRAFIAMRSRYAEDQLAAAIARGVRQYVVLGAGLDTFAYRGTAAAGELRVFEVDHPATQAWKRGRLGEAGIAIPASLSFVPVDFERQTLAAALGAAGFTWDVPAFFSWLGVTVYLPERSVMETFELIAGSAASGSAIAFSFIDRPSPLARRTAAAGEPWRTYFEPGALAAALRQRGFRRADTLDPAAANARYFTGRTDDLRVAGGGHLMTAEV
jgi:methyltransferase (TIGR00027 family)